MRSGLPATLTRSLLLVVLAVAVAGMHHLLGELPGDAPHAATRPHMTVTPASDGAQAEESGNRAGALCCFDTRPVTGERDDPMGGHSGHELLHLCLAILTAVVGVALTLCAFGGRLPAAAPASRAGRGVSPFARPPPPSHARRLAVLGVSRL
ncbi:hypothetical protein [Nocardia sp. X0981]